MAIIGFILLLVLGLFLVAQGTIGAYIVYAFSGKHCYGCIIPLLIGMAVLYYAIANSPIHISISGE